MGPVILECFGLPGAGKTTVLNQVVARLANRGQPVASVDDLRRMVSTYSTWKKGICISQSFGAREVLNLGRYLCLSRPMSSSLITRSLKTGIFEIYLRNFKGDFEGAFICLDQWTIQLAWSSAVGLNSWHYGSLCDLIKGFLRVLPRACVYFDIGVDEAAARIAHRGNGGSRFDGLKRAEIRDRLNAEVGRMNRLREWVEKSTDTFVVIDAEQSIGDKVEILEKWLLTLRASNTS